MKHLQHALFGLALSAWSFTATAETVPFDSTRWEFHGGTHEVIADYVGKQALKLAGGKAYLPDVSMTNGVIEFDVLFTKDFSSQSTLKDNRAFVAGVFRLQDPENFEKFYMRPHRLPIDEDGAQYVPVYNDWSSWQLFWTGHITPVTYVYDQWSHVKLLFSGTYLEAYINDMTTPLLKTSLKRPLQAGHVGVKVDTQPPSSYAYFANFSYESNDNPPFVGTPIVPEAAPAGTVLKWDISDTFTEEEINSKMMLTEADRKARTWQALEADASTGITNLAMAHKIVALRGGDKKNTVFARTVIMSDKAQLKKLQFGFTDIARIYFNGKLMYSEDNQFRVRNKNFMGTTGYFNEIYLPLKPGANELWISVTGLLASWGAQARLADSQGVSFDNSMTARLDAPEMMNDYCTATYKLTGELHIPCVAVPTGVGEEYGVLDVEMKQQSNPSASFTFDLNLNSIKYH